MTAQRRILLVAHPRREEVLESARIVIGGLVEAGIEVLLAPEDARAFAGSDLPTYSIAPAESPAADCELVCVLGGDGTILRGAQWAHGTGTPVLGVNLGHVGFLAEAERDDLTETVARMVARDYTVDERMTLLVVASQSDREIARSWALNEVSVEKAARERMLELTIEVDDRPLSSWGGDGVVVSTPTGSTAYAFSAGGPIVWPDVEAMLVVPVSAHALFARPLVLSPQTRVAVEVRAETEGHGVMWCDGRRAVDLPPGARIEVTRGEVPIRLARLTRKPFADRLVAKFGLPVEGWRGRRAGLRAER